MKTNKTSKSAFGSDALVVVPQADIATMEAFDMVSGGNEYFPRLQIMAVQNEFVVSGTIKGGSLALVQGGEPEDLTNSTDALVLAWMPKALSIDGDEILSSNDVNSELFAEIKSKSSEQDSGCMYGPEFLVYIPSAEKFATFFMSSKSARRVAPKLLKLIGKAATIETELVTNKKKQSWFVPVIKECTTPFEIPEQDKITENVNKFLTPESEEDVVADDKKSSRKR